MKRETIVALLEAEAEEARTLPEVSTEAIAKRFKRLAFDLTAGARIDREVARLRACREKFTQ